MTALLLVIAQRYDSGETSVEKMTWTDAMFVGLLQVVAIVPGVSRSGSTIFAGLFRGLRREDAARFSFLIAIPAICGAVVLTGYKIYQGEGGSNEPSVLAVGAVIAFLVGILALRSLIWLVINRRLHWFAWYCALAGAATVTWQIAKSIVA